MSNLVLTIFDVPLKEHLPNPEVDLKCQNYITKIDAIFMPLALACVLIFHFVAEVCAAQMPNFPSS